MSLFLASVLFGIVPMAIYAAIVCWIDRWEREPIPLLIAAFGWGSIPSVVFAVVAQVVLGMPNGAEEVSLSAELFQASIVAPFTEEIVKGFGLLLIFLIFRNEIDSVLDGLIYGSMIGFGFAAVENVLYFAGETHVGGLLGLVFLRAVIFGMLHALFTGLTGVGFALGKFSTRPAMKILWPLLGLALAIFTHALHNYFATIGGDHIFAAVIGISVGMLWFIFTIVFCLVRENQWIRLQLADEVTRGILSEEQAHDTAHFWKRSGLNLFSSPRSVSRKRRQLLHLATKLSYRKQQQDHFEFSDQREREIESLRNKVRKLSREDPLFAEREKRMPPPLPSLPPPLPFSQKHIREEGKT